MFPVGGGADRSGKELSPEAGGFLALVIIVCAVGLVSTTVLLWNDTSAWQRAVLLTLDALSAVYAIIASVSAVRRWND